ncbi:MAG: hypothetical protein LBL66_02035 [Clostridiales bacterium]|jgi:hypothetical protein|nr:hypothetical protein [Clostridiales bacterium]
MIEVVTKFDKKTLMAFGKFTYARSFRLLAVFFVLAALGVLMLWVDRVLAAVAFGVSAIFLSLNLLSAFFSFIRPLFPTQANKLIRTGSKKYYSFDNAFIYTKSVDESGTENVFTLAGAHLQKAAENKEYFFYMRRAAHMPRMSVLPPFISCPKRTLRPARPTACGRSCNRGCRRKNTNATAKN